MNNAFGCNTMFTGAQMLFRFFHTVCKTLNCLYILWAELCYRVVDGTQWVLMRIDSIKNCKPTMNIEYF